MGQQNYRLQQQRMVENQRESFKKYDYQCRFCGFKFQKYLVLDHKDGDATNNNIDNFGLNCGFAGIQKQIVIYQSDLTQQKINQLCNEYLVKNNKIPDVREIDPNAKDLKTIIVNGNQKNLNPDEKGLIYSNQVASYMIQGGNEFINQNYIKGFPSKDFDMRYVKYYLK